MTLVTVCWWQWGHDHWEKACRAAFKSTLRPAAVDTRDLGASYLRASCGARKCLLHDTCLLAAAENISMGYFAFGCKCLKTQLTLIESWLLCFLSTFLLMHFLWGSRSWFKYLDPWLPRGKPRWSSWPPVDEKSLSLSLSLILPFKLYK